MDDKNNVSKKIGDGKESLIYEGNETIKSDIKLMEYDKKISKIEKFEKCRKFEQDDAVKWIKINGFSHIEAQEIGKCFNLHPLVIEDITTDQRPKLEEYQDYLFIVMKIFNFSNSEIITKQSSFILGKNFVISFFEEDIRIFDSIEKQIGIKESLIRDNGADFLLYSLLDAVVDSYFVIIEELEDKIDIIQKELIDNASRNTLNSINELKKDILTLKKGIWPLKELTITLKTSNFSLIEESTSFYIRDVYDHTIQVSDMLDTFKDTVSGMLDTYLSSLSNNLNEIVRVLTIISVIFVPLTFITGFFGMNFENLINVISVPQILDIALVVMIIIPLLMLIYFKRKRWL